MQRLRQQRQHGNGARITKNNAGRGTPSTPQARPSDVKRRFTHRDFSRPVICAGAICHYPEMKKRGDYTRPQRARTSACSNAQNNTRRQPVNGSLTPPVDFSTIFTKGRTEGAALTAEIFSLLRVNGYRARTPTRKACGRRGKRLLLVY